MKSDVYMMVFMKVVLLKKNLREEPFRLTSKRRDSRRYSVVLKLEQAMTQETIERFAVGAGHGVLIEIS